MWRASAGGAAAEAERTGTSAARREPCSRGTDARDCFVGVAVRRRGWELAVCGVFLFDARPPCRGVLPCRWGSCDSYLRLERRSRRLGPAAARGALQQRGLCASRHRGSRRTHGHCHLPGAQSWICAVCNESKEGYMAAHSCTCGHRPRREKVGAPLMALLHLSGRSRCPTHTRPWIKREYLGWSVLEAQCGRHQRGSNAILDTRGVSPQLLIGRSGARTYIKEVEGHLVHWYLALVQADTLISNHYVAAGCEQFDAPNVADQPRAKRVG